ncbi:MAG: FmdE family protein [Desulfovibrionaceae bacterium]
MSCTYPKERIEAVIAFHGHSCPGLTIGIRASELARLRWPDATDRDLMAVVETDMCGVDAIQHLLGCTFGKGNLIHRDYGKMAFSFYNRPLYQAFRAVLRPEARQGMDVELGDLMAKEADGEATPEDAARISDLRSRMQEVFMALPLDAMFAVRELTPSPPRPARILTSLRCALCGEMVMESRTRRLGGQTLCIPCFNTVEQKI